MVKERFGSGSNGIGINLNVPNATSHAQHLDHPIFQPFVAGREISIDGWISEKGVVEGVVLRYRDTVIGGESQVTTTFSNAGFEKQASIFLKNLNLKGPVVLQAIICQDKLQFIECNPRFGGASTLAISCGLDTYILESF